MLTAEQNEELTQVAAGTPMGELLRRYWYPVAFTRELEEFPIKAARLLGWRPTVTLEDGLARSYAAFAAQHEARQLTRTP